MATADVTLRGWRDDELFPDAYKHTVTRKAVYPIGMPLAVILGVFGLLFIAVIIGYRIAWNNATKVIRESAETYDAADKTAHAGPVPGMVPLGAVMEAGFVTEEIA